jgi:hypothetical protein
MGNPLLVPAENDWSLDILAVRFLSQITAKDPVFLGHYV